MSENRNKGGGGIHERIGLLYAWALLIVVFLIVKPAVFGSLNLYASILGGQSAVVILTLALIVPLAAGEFDLSAAAMLALSAMIIAVLNVDMGVPVGLAILAALAVSLAVGALNAFLVIRLGIGSLITTLGMATLLQGAVRWISDSRTIYGISDSLVGAVLKWRVFGVAPSFYYALIVSLVLWYVFTRTPFGLKLLFVGRGPEVARLNGVAVDRVRMGALMSSSFIAALGGVVYAGTSGAADPVSGFTLLLPAFAGAFLGSTAITPGRFNPWGSLFGMYFLATGITGLVTIGAPSFVQDLFYGGALIVAVATAQLLRRWREKRA